MATVAKPIALDESFNTTEQTSRNIADVLAEGIGDLVHAVSQIAPQTVYDLDDLGDVDITSLSNGQVLKYNGTSQKWENGAGGGGGGGHTIQDATGTSLTQRSNLQFKGARVSDDSTNDRTVVDATCETIDWEDWIEMSSQEQEAYKIAHPDLLILDAPGADGNISADLLTELWSNPNPTADFTSQNITLSSSDYDFLLILANYVKSGTNYIPPIICPKGDSFMLTTAIAVSGGARSFYRSGNRTSDTTYVVGNCDYATGVTAASTANNYLIPMVIYGIKKTINLNFSAIASDVSTSADKCMLSDGLTSVEDRLDAHTVGTGVNIKNYTSTPYVAPSDGYVRVQSGGTAGGRNIVNIGGITNAIVQRTPGTEQGTAGTYFVRKGTEILEVGDNSGTGGSTYFYPLQ